MKTMSIPKTSLTIGMVLLAMAVTGTLVAALLTSSKTVSNSGNVRAIGVGVYSDSGCTMDLTSINWGSFTAGSSKNYTIYVKNEGSVAVVLSKSTSNWNPASASTYMTFSWNRDSYVLNAGTSVSAVLTLAVASNINGISTFSFDITITGTERT
jgi:archaellum component FlaG (FlaF/FlaG flagellin family)